MENKANIQKFKGKVNMNFKINEVDIKSPPMSIKDEIVHDKPNINVSTGEVRLKFQSG